MPDQVTDVERAFEHRIGKLLVGRRVTGVRYMPPAEAELQMWASRPLVIELDDGTAIVPARDDEGNDGGALFITTRNGKEVRGPVMR